MFLSVIIPAYNSKNFLGKALSSIFIQNYEGLEVIVVDNGSSDGTRGFIKDNYPKVTLITNTENKGTSFARNQGIAAAKGEYIMFLDSDAYLKEGFFEKLERILKTLPQSVGAVSPRIIKAGSDRIFSCGLKVSSLYRVYDIGKNKDAGAFNDSFFVDGPNTCCGVYRRDILEELKEDSYFDEDFFFLFEDADLALRLKKKRYKCLFVPQLVCCHYKGGSGFPDNYRRFLCFRNRMFMILKYNKGKKLLGFLLRSFFYDSLRAIHFVLTNPYFPRVFRDIYKKITRHL